MSPSRGADRAAAIEALEGRVLLAFSAAVNFQPSGTLRVPGYAVDKGYTFRQQGELTYGWSRTHTSTAVDRNKSASPDQRYDTHNTLTFGPGGATWEIAVPNGLYEVRIVAGDPVYSPGDNYRVLAEGTPIVAGYQSSANRWIDRTGYVAVEDGRLTLTTIKSAVRTKLCFVEVRQLTYAGWKLQAEANDGSEGVFNSGTSITDQADGGYVKFDDVYFGVNRFKSVFASVSLQRDVHQHVEFRIDAPDGPVIAWFDVQPTGPEAGAPFMTQHASVEPVSGVHDLYIVFRDGDGGAPPPEGGTVLDHFRFSTKALTRVMILGDSITEGRGGYASYRHALYNRLLAAGYDHVDFVGTRRGVREGGGLGEAIVYDYDQDHEGHGGFRLDDVLYGALEEGTGQYSGTLSDWLAAIEPPDVVIVNLGINDLIVWDSVESTVAQVGLVIDRLRKRNPNVKVLLTQLAPVTADRVPDAWIREFNAGLAALVPLKNKKASRVKVVDLYNIGFDPTPGVDTIDGLHPNASGELKIAAAYDEALRPWL